MREKMPTTMQAVRARSELALLLINPCELSAGETQKVLLVAK
jgi:hypothetical protein